MGRPKRAPARSSGRGAPSSGGTFLPLVILLAAALLLYGNTLFNEFVHDDKPLVAESLLVNDPSRMVEIFTSGYWTTRTESVPELYRPLTVLTFALNHRVGGSSPFGYHLFNVLLHGWVSWLVFRVTLALGANAAAAWAAALLFVAHPVHVEAVAPVVGRSELLAAGFCLAALLLHRRRDGAANGWVKYFVAAACYLAASLSKESALVFPALALLADWAFPSRDSGSPAFSWRAYLLYAGAAASILAMRIGVLGAVAQSDIRPLDNPLVTLARVPALGTALVALGKYLQLLVWPWRLSADYSGGQISPVMGISDLRLALSLAGMIFVAALAAWGWKRQRLAAYGLLFLGIALLPVANLFFFIGTIFGERLLYLPSVGFCLAVGSLWGEWRRRSAGVATGALALALLAGSTRTVSRNAVWRNDATFALATSRNAPASPKAQFNWGVFLEEHASYPEAEAAYRRAADLAPDWPDPRYNLAGILSRAGRLAESIDEYRRALAGRPGDPRIVLNLGYALYRAGRHREAVELYEGFLRERGESAAVLNSLGANLLAMGQAQEAVEAFRRAVALAPGEAGYRVNLQEALEAAGKASHEEP